MAVQGVITHRSLGQTDQDPVPRAGLQPGADFLLMFLEMEVQDGLTRLGGRLQLDVCHAVGPDHVSGSLTPHARQGILLEILEFLLGHVGRIHREFSDDSLARGLAFAIGQSHRDHGQGLAVRDHCRLVGQHGGQHRWAGVVHGPRFAP